MSTPAMKQWRQVKEKYPDHLVLFRMGDFYEMFYDDAKEGARILGITLTKRGTKEEVPLAGIPAKSLDLYLKKLVENNKKVVIVEQVEDPKLAKGVVKRDIFKELTPGTIAFSELLNEKENNYLGTLYMEIKDHGNRPENDYYLVFGDILTGDYFIYFSTDLESVAEKIALYEIKELLIDKKYYDFAKSQNFLKDVFITAVDFNSLIKEVSFFEEVEKKISDIVDNILNNFKGELDVHYDNFAFAFKVFFSYIKKTQRVDSFNVKKLHSLKDSKYMYLDESTIRNLDLIKNSYTGDEKGTLYEVLNATLTPFGARLLKRIILQPLLDLKEINKRLQIVEFFVNNVVLLESVRDLLKEFFDIERIAGKINNNTAKVQDLLMLKHSLKVYRELYTYLTQLSMFFEFENPSNFESLFQLLQDSLNEDYSQDYVIKEGYCEELDELRKIKDSADDFLREFERKEKERTGIQNLRVKYNSIFGFFIEVPRGQISKVPANYIRKQTILNAERYITQELKEFENKYLSAEERIKEIEESLLDEILEKCKVYVHSILSLSEKLAFLDVFGSFAKIALNHNYTKPIFEGRDIIIIGGRHPIVERYTDFVSNDTHLFDREIIILTGPNMSGKSTYLRQVGLIQIMAQIGSFVPAKYAKLPLVDALFTRIGARDNVVYGESTFMVEMKETANILKNATQNSLIILDEVGRGTSTYDGISLAWSIVEYILFHLGSKTLFATHYHVLTQMETLYNRIKNYHTKVIEKGDEIIFERKIAEGGLDKSYGIHVAKLAGLPSEVINRAMLLQKAFEKYDNLKNNVIRSLYLDNIVSESKNVKKEKTLTDKKNDEKSGDLSKWLN
ncbi:MAG: DNA mismatch repair protein MutS [Candidatus Woesearchaeota archaeon]